LSWLSTDSNNLGLIGITYQSYIFPNLEPALETGALLHTTSLQTTAATLDRTNTRCPILAHPCPLPRPVVLCHAVLLDQHPHSVSLNGAHSTTVGFVQANDYSWTSVRIPNIIEAPNLACHLVSSHLNFWILPEDHYCRALSVGVTRWWPQAPCCRELKPCRCRPHHPDNVPNAKRHRALSAVVASKR
jgi:hypothetical protein